MTEIKGKNGNGYKNFVISILLGVCAFLASKGLDSLLAGNDRSHSNEIRITRLEENYKNISENLAEIKEAIKKQ